MIGTPSWLNSYFQIQAKGSKCAKRAVNAEWEDMLSCDVVQTSPQCLPQEIKTLFF